MMRLAPSPRTRKLITSVLTTFGLIVTALGGAGAIFVLQPFGHRIWALGAATALLVSIAWRFRGPGLTRKAILGGLAGWIGLIAWSAASPGGEMPPPKNDPATVRVLTWNILMGAEGGPLWKRHGWSVRKPALRAALKAAGPDILCVQEALGGQMRFLEAELPHHRRVGVGRDDGRSAGEHCAIYFDADRFQELDGGTFWLEEPTDSPPENTALGPKRICTWVRLRDRSSGRPFRVYNTHLYLTERARQAAVRGILARVGSGDPSDAILIAGDFNAAPDATSRRLFLAAGLESGTALAGVPAGQPTYQFYGIRLGSLDGLYLGRGWRLMHYQVVDVKPGNTFPSDHFGVMADLKM
jgi:endonuclease/exonuclease/phosphatase family metal-dependent hydrolase